MLFRLPILILCGSATAIAQSQRLSIDDAIRFAWANDPSVTALALGPELARAREVQAGIRPSPGLELHGSTPSPLQNEGEWALGVSVTQRLPRRERVEQARALARIGGEAASLQLREQRRRLAGEVRLRYYEAVLQRARRDAASRNIEAQREALASLERLRLAGELSDADLEMLRLELARTEQAQELAEAELVSAHQRLRSRLRLPAAQSFELVSDLDAILARTLPEDAAPDEMGRPELALAAHAVREAEAALGLARAESRPEWTAGAGVDFERRVNDATRRLENEPRLSFSASVPWPGRVSNRGEILEKQAALRIAEAREAALSEELKAELSSALAAVQTLQPVLARRRAALASSSGLPESLRAAFERGEVTSQQLAIMHQQRIAIESDFLAAAARYVAALAEAETLAGTVPVEP